MPIATVMARFDGWVTEMNDELILLRRKFDALEHQELSAHELTAAAAAATPKRSSTRMLPGGASSALRDKIDRKKLELHGRMERAHTLLGAEARTIQALLARFWSAEAVAGAEGTDAFKQSWAGERLLVHAPVPY